MIDCLGLKGLGTKEGCLPVGTDLLFDVIKCCEIDFGSGHTTDYIKKTLICRQIVWYLNHVSKAVLQKACIHTCMMMHACNLRGEDWKIVNLKTA